MSKVMSVLVDHYVILLDLNVYDNMIEIESLFGPCYYQVVSVFLFIRFSFDIL